MLDSFLEVAYGHEKKAQAQAELMEMMQGLPMEELARIANGESELNKVACMAGSTNEGDWLDKFKGSPLLEQAIELEQQLLEIEMADLEQREMEDEQRKGREDFWTQKDKIRVQKKLLDIELAKQETEGMMAEQEAPAPMPAPQPAPPAPAPQPPPSGPVVDPEAVKAAAVGPKGAGQFLSGASRFATKMTPKVAPELKMLPTSVKKTLQKTKKAAAVDRIGRLLARADMEKSARSREENPTAKDRVKGGLKGLASGAAVGAGGAGLGAVLKGEGWLKNLDKKTLARTAKRNAIGIGALTAALGAAYPKKSKKKEAAAVEEQPEGHIIRRALLGNPISAAIEAEPGEKMRSFGEGYGHLVAQQLLGAGKGALIGGGAGALLGGGLGLAGPFLPGRPVGKLEAALRTAGTLGTLGGIGGAGVGSIYGNLKGHLGQEASEIHGRRSKHGKKQETPDSKEASARFAAALDHMQKEAFLGAVGAGLSGAAKFIGGAGKAVKGAYQSGGLKGAGEALQQKATTGVRKAGRFAAANPGAAAAMGAGTLGLAGGAGYLAG